MQAEDLHRDENDRRLLCALRLGEIKRHVAACDGDLGHANIKTFSGRVDRIGTHRPGGERIARSGSASRRHKAAPRQGRDFGQTFDIGHDRLRRHP